MHLCTWCRSPTFRREHFHVHRWWIRPFWQHLIAILGFLQCGCVRDDILSLAKLMWNRGGHGDIEVTSPFLCFVGCSFFYCFWNRRISNWIDKMIIGRFLSVKNFWEPLGAACVTKPRHEGNRWRCELIAGDRSRSLALAPLCHSCWKRQRYLIESAEFCFCIDKSPQRCKDEKFEKVGLIAGNVVKSLMWTSCVWTMLLSVINTLSHPLRLELLKLLIMNNPALVPGIRFRITTTKNRTWIIFFGTK